MADTGKASQHHTQRKQIELREVIRKWLVAHPGARPIEVSRCLKIHQQTASKHVTAIREQWQRREKRAAQNGGSA